MEIVHCTTNIGIKLTVNESRCNGDTTNVRSKLWRKITRNVGGITSKILPWSKYIATVYRDLLINSHCAGKLDVLADDVCDFLQFVTSDFTSLSPDDTFLPLGADTSVRIISVAEVGLTDSLSRIKTNKAAGPDEIHNWILRDYATTLVTWIAKFYNQMANIFVMPTQTAS